MYYVGRLIMNTVHFESLFESLCQKLKSTNNLDNISCNFAQLTSDRERVHFLLQLDAVQHHFQLPDDHESVAATQQKSPIVAVSLRNKGNQYFKSKKYMAALEKYTESLSYAPLLEDKPGAEDSPASLAFANRSAVLFQLGKHQLCLDDISHAFSMSYPPALAYKLYDRRGQCLLALDQSSEAELSFHAAVEALAVSDLEGNRRQQWHVDLQQRIRSCEQKHSVDPGPSVPELSIILCQDIPECERNSCYESLSDACDVTCDAVLGRYIVTKQDIQPGTVVLSEKPYASIMLADSQLDHCSHCYKFTLAPIPCPSCCRCLYCSAGCRDLAYKSYHRVECTLGQIIEESGVDKFAFLAIRTLVVTPLDVIYKFCGPLSRSPHNNVKSDFQNGEVYRADSYEAICGLVTHAQDRTAHDLFRRAVIAIFLLRCLCFAGFFETKNPPVDVLSGAGGLLLSHLQSFPCNAHEIAEFDLDTDAVATSTPHELGAGIYATLSLFNHSCDPAVTRNFYGDRCIVRTIRTVRAGDELSDNYGAVFAMQPRSERRAKLRPQYFFECNCTACIEDWPLYSVLRETGPKWRCNNCFSALPSGSTKCNQCGLEMSLAKCVEKLGKSDKMYRDAFDKLLKCCVNEALPAFLSHLRVMDEILCPPCAGYAACQEAVKQCFSIMANCRCINQIQA